MVHKSIVFVALCSTNRHTSIQQTLLSYQDLRYTVVLDNESANPLLINVTSSIDLAFTHFLLWRRNGRVINATSAPRISVQDEGGLLIRSVRASDAGQYSVIASDGGQCQSVRFTLYIECELVRICNY